MSLSFTVPTEEMPLMPLREVVMFPKSIVPLFVGREASIRAIETAIDQHERHILLVAQKDSALARPLGADLFEVGTVSRILQLLRLPDGTIKVLFEGLFRARWEFSPSVPQDQTEESAFQLVLIRPLPPDENSGAEAAAAVRATLEALDGYARINKKFTPDLLASITAHTDPGRLADAIIPHLKVDYLKKQEVLEAADTAARLEMVFALLQGELSISSMEKRIKTRVKNQMERNQREYYLNEQIKAIHKEMGREDDPLLELNELEKRLQEKDMPGEARSKALREVKKLRQMPATSAEYTVVRNYVDWILDLPWNDLKPIDIDIENARATLDGGHYGLEKPKERILEYLAVQKL
ncbi:MAG: LON peptidase substrate-binding domain-containing protein, partial [Desulfovibrio sp.]|nr:LON peptidase substrate-binding domain-containing protein [Desulfovibrio sp.]